MQGTHHVLNGILLVGAVALLAGLQLVKGHAKKSGHVLHAQSALFHELGVPVGDGDGLVFQAVVQDGHTAGVGRSVVPFLPFLPHNILGAELGAVLQHRVRDA